MLAKTAQISTNLTIIVQPASIALPSPFVSRPAVHRPCALVTPGALVSAPGVQQLGLPMTCVACRAHGEHGRVFT